MVDTDELLSGEAPQGLVPLNIAPLGGREWLFSIDSRGYFAPRPEVEEDPGRKQIIPYCVVTQEAKLLLLRRLSGGGEQRLHHLLSVGVGGHINPSDETSDQGGRLLVGARRELWEEIVIEEPFRMEVVGFVNDDSNAVGSVHFGVIFRVRVKGKRPEIRETNQLEGTMVSWDQAAKRLEQEPEVFETWSRIVLSGWTGMPDVGIDLVSL